MMPPAHFPFLYTILGLMFLTLGDNGQDMIGLYHHTSFLHCCLR